MNALLTLTAADRHRTMARKRRLFALLAVVLISSAVAAVVIDGPDVPTLAVFGPVWTCWLAARYMLRCVACDKPVWSPRAASCPHCGVSLSDRAAN
jgi:hypothetical protein